MRSETMKNNWTKSEVHACVRILRNQLREMWFTNKKIQTKSLLISKQKQKKITVNYREEIVILKITGCDIHC